MESGRPANQAQDRRAAMDALLGRFTWPVEQEFMRPDFEVLTDFDRRVHVICWPREASGKQAPFDRSLHELGHALLAESIHPQFSRPFFATGQDPALLNTYRALFEAALDWFVQGLLMETAPAFQGPDIDERFRQATDMLRRGMALPSVEFVVDSGMSLASFARHRGLEVETKGKLRDVMGAFLRAAPDRPNLFALHGLVRTLMKGFELHTARLVREHGFERWRILPVKRG